MKLSILNLALIITLLSSSILFSQENWNDNKKGSFIPPSIYSFQSTNININSKFSINQRLNFENYHFRFVNRKSIEEGYFAIPFSTSGNKPSNLIFDTYNDIYHTMNLQSSFFKVSKLYNVASRIKK